MPSFIFLYLIRIGKGPDFYTYITHIMYSYNLCYVIIVFRVLAPPALSVFQDIGFSSSSFDLRTADTRYHLFVTYFSSTIPFS